MCEKRKRLQKKEEIINKGEDKGKFQIIFHLRELSVYQSLTVLNSLDTFCLLEHHD